MFDTLGNPLFSCSLDITNVETQSLSLIKIHGKSNNPRRGKTYYCIVCQLVSRDKKDCLSHVEKHINGLVYTCLMCTHTTLTKNSMKVHIMKHNRFDNTLSDSTDPLGEEKEYFSCSLDKTFVETEALSMIERQEINGTHYKRNYKCFVCQRMCKDKYDCMRHVKYTLKDLYTDACCGISNM